MCDAFLQPQDLSAVVNHLLNKSLDVMLFKNSYVSLVRHVEACALHFAFIYTYC